MQIIHESGSLENTGQGALPLDNLGGAHENLDITGVLYSVIRTTESSLCSVPYAVLRRNMMKSTT